MFGNFYLYLQAVKTNSMSKVNFRLRSKAKKKVSIKIYLSFGRNNFIEMNSGFSIHPKDWSSKTNLPLQNDPENKNLYSNLKKLEAFIYENLNLSIGNGELIDRFWLENTIKNCFKRVERNDTGFLLDHIQFIIDNAHTKKIKGKNKLGLSESRIKSYVTFKSLIELYQNRLKKQIHFLDVNKQFIHNFTSWLIDSQKYSMNYSGKQIDNIKTVCLDAFRLGIPVNSYVHSIESFSESDEERLIVTLSLEELKKIRDSKMPTKSLNNAKNWLLLGCEIGQRGGDLLSLTKDNLRLVDDFLFVDILQQKTKKMVTIPVGSKQIREILENDFPRSISQQKLNNYIKMVCEWAGINETTEGKIFSSELKRKVSGHFPKYQLVTSHSFRRSFATNYYKKIATPILMTITGHSKESIFLKYINKQEDKDDNARLFMQYYKELNV